MKYSIVQRQDMSFAGKMGYLKSEKLIALPSDVPDDRQEEADHASDDRAIEPYVLQVVADLPLDLVNQRGVVELRKAPPNHLADRPVPFLDEVDRRLADPLVETSPEGRGHRVVPPHALRRSAGSPG